MFKKIKKQELNLIEEKVRKLINAKQMKKYNLDREFKELPNVQFSNYDEMKKAIDKKKASVIINFLNYSYAPFGLISKTSEELFFWISLYLTYIITILMIGIAIFLNNYYLLISILWLIIASKFSSYYTNPPLYPFKGRRIADIALIIGVFTWLFFGNITITLLSFSYVLIHWSYHFHRKTYGTVLHDRALQSELLFQFLYIGNYIRLSQAEGKKSIFDNRL